MYFSGEKWNEFKSSAVNGSTHDSNSVIEDKDVVIIGGGCAGVECASKLISYGIRNIVVLEGTKRPFF